jgi:hypothetical protein
MVMRIVFAGPHLKKGTLEVKSFYKALSIPDCEVFP